MAKNNNLTDFLTDVANAIREKKNKTGLINPQDFSAEILGIETGGGGSIESKEYKDVNFFDYEGTILYSYTWDEAKVMTELPPLPDRTSEGLICQGWNYTLEEMKAQADENGNNGYADIGAIYTTIDGKSWFYINLFDKLTLDYVICIYAYSKKEYIIEWGDGTLDTIKEASNTQRYVKHRYLETGRYVVKVYSLDGSIVRFPVKFTAVDQNSLTLLKFTVEKVYIGNNVNIANTFFTYFNLSSITLANNTKIEGHCFTNTSLRHLTLPRYNGINGNGSCMHMYDIKSVSIPHSYARWSGQFLYGAEHIHTLKVPNSVSSYDGRSFQNVTPLAKLCLPPSFNSVTSIPAEFIFGSCLVSFTVPSGVTSVGKDAFRGNGMMRRYNFTMLSVVPTLANAAFAGIHADCKIVVPDELVDEWRAADNWANYATYIVGKTEYINGGGIL